MTQQTDFSGVWIKVERAKEHYRDLYARYQEFRQANLYEVIAHDDSPMLSKAARPDK